MAACRLDHGCGEDPCVCQPPAKPYPKTQRARENQERLECGCRIASPVWRNKWRVVERGVACRFHIVGERLYIPSGRFGVAPR